MRKILIAAALTLTPVAAHAEDWVLVSVNDNRHGAMFVDADSISAPQGSIRHARLLAVLREDQGGYAAALGDAVIDCAARKQRFEAFWPYDFQGNAGPKEGGTDWVPVQPGTTYDGAFKTICGERPMDGRHFGAQLPIAAGRAMLQSQSQ